VAGDPTLSRLLLRTRLFFLFGGGRSLHNVHFLIFLKPFDIPFARFTNSGPKAFLSNSLILLSLLRRSCHLVRGSFILVSLRSCCLRPRFLMPFLYSKPFHSPFPSFRRFGVSCSVLFLLQSLLTKTLFTFQAVLLNWNFEQNRSIN
jgi:hypothetical protein